MIVIISIFITACGTKNRNVNFYEGFAPTASLKFDVPLPIDLNGKSIDELDICNELKINMIDKLIASGIYADNTYVGERVNIPCDILEYEPGNAFKRWLMPFYGSTVLSVKCNLVNVANDNVVGIAEARHTVDAGGGYTINAWKNIFGALSYDIVNELKSKLSK